MADDNVDQALASLRSNPLLGSPTADETSGAVQSIQTNPLNGNPSRYLGAKAAENAAKGTYDPAEFDQHAKVLQEDFHVDPEQLRQPYEQARLLADAHEHYKDYHENAQRFLKRRMVPGASMLMNYAIDRQYEEARDRMAAGKPEREDYDKIARYEKDKQNEASQGLGMNVLSGVAGVPAILGESFAAGGTLRALGMGAKAVEGASLASRAAGFAGRTAATTALMPSMVVPGASQRAVETGGSPTDLKNLAPAAALGFLQTAVLGSLGQFGNIPGEGWKYTAQRIGTKTGIGVGEQQIVDVLAGAAGLQTGYGAVGDLLQGRGGEALKHLTVQAATFGAFSAMHGGNPDPLWHAFKTELAGQQRLGRSGDGAALDLAKGFETLEAAYRKDPNASRADIKKFLETLPAGPPKAFAQKAAEALPEKPTEAPDESRDKKPTKIPTALSLDSSALLPGDEKVLATLSPEDAKQITDALEPVQEAATPPQPSPEAAKPAETTPEPSTAEKPPEGTPEAGEANPALEALRKLNVNAPQGSPAEKPRLPMGALPEKPAVQEPPALSRIEKMRQGRAAKGLHGVQPEKVEVASAGEDWMLQGKKGEETKILRPEKANEVADFFHDSIDEGNHLTDEEVYDRFGLDEREKEIANLIRRDGMSLREIEASGKIKDAKGQPIGYEGVRKAGKKIAQKLQFDGTLHELFRVPDKEAAKDVRSKGAKATEQGDLNQQASQRREKELNDWAQRYEEAKANGPITAEQEQELVGEYARLSKERTRRTEGQQAGTAAAAGRQRQAPVRPEAVAGHEPVGENATPVPPSEGTEASAARNTQAASPPAQRGEATGDQLKKAVKDFLSGESGALDLEGLKEGLGRVKDRLFGKVAPEPAETPEQRQERVDNLRAKSSLYSRGAAGARAKGDLETAKMFAQRSTIAMRQANDIEAGKKVITAADLMPVQQAVETTKGTIRAERAQEDRQNKVNAHELSKGLREFDDTVKKAGDDTDKLKENFLGVSRGIEGGDLSQVDPQFRKAAEIQQKQIEESKPVLKSLKIVNEFIDNYLVHMWADPKNAKATPEDIGTALRNAMSKRSMAGGESFRNQRLIPTYEDGFNAGLTPKSWNPFEMHLLGQMAVNHSIAGRRAFETLKDAGVFKYYKLGERLPEGWKLLDDKLGKVFTGGDRGPQLLGNYAGPTEVINLVERHLSPGLQGNTVYDAARGLANRMNQYTLGLSGFHALGTALNVQFSTMGLGLKMISRGDFSEGFKTIAKGATPYSWYRTGLLGTAGKGEYLVPGSNHALSDLVNQVVEGGARIGLDNFYKTGAISEFKRSFEEFKKGNLELGHAALPLKAADALAELFNKPVMEHWVPAAKLGIAMERIRYEMDWAQRHGVDMTQAEQRSVFGRIWDSVDNRLGQLVYDNLFWNRTFKDAAMLTVRAVGWNVGTWREIGGAIKDIPGSLKGLKSGEGISDRAAYTIALTMGSAVMGAIAHRLLTGQNPEELKDYFFPRTGKTNADGTAERLSFPTYLHHDIAPLFNRADEGPYTVLGNVKKAAVGKLNPLLSQSWEVASNEDWKGSAIRNPNDPVVQQTQALLKHLLAGVVPISVQNYQKNKDASTGMQAAGALGITPANASIRRTWDEQRALEAKRHVQLTPLEKLKKEEAGPAGALPKKRVKK